jgi:hypothetical protein
MFFLTLLFLYKKTSGDFKLKRLLRKSKKIKKNLPFTIEESEKQIQNLTSLFFDLSNQVSSAGKNQDKNTIMILIDELLTTNEQIKENEKYIEQRKNNPDEYQLLMW